MKNNTELFNAYGILLSKEVMRNLPDSIEKMSDERIYEYINIFYKRCYGKSLDIKHDKERLFEFARSQVRYELLTDVIKKIIIRIFDSDEDLKTVDSFILNNLSSIHKNIYADVWNYVANFKFEECELSKLTKDEVINIVKGILINVDPSLEWLKIYNDIPLKKIVYLNELSLDEKKKLYDSLADYDSYAYNNSWVKTKAGDDLILLTYNGTTMDVVNTIHEFIHYINVRNKKENIKANILLEFPSIFYEYYALNYLRKLGCSDKEIKYLESARTYDLECCIMDTFMIWYYIRIFEENYEISEELDIKYFSLANRDTKEITLDDIKREVHEECDDCTELIMSNPDLLEIAITYIVGSYLALNSINRVDDDMLRIMKEYTENIDDYNPYDIFVGLGIDTDEIDLKRVENRRKRVRN